MNLKAELMSMLMGMVMKVFTPELLKQFMDMFLDFCEDHVLGSKSKMDDLLILPIIKSIRIAYEIPDDDIPDNEQKDIAEADSLPPPDAA